MSGLQADARSLVEHARVETQNHAFHYAEPLRVESCTQAICDLALRFGETGDDEESVMSRPFGVALLIAGIDEDGPQLYVAPPLYTSDCLFAFPRLYYNPVACFLGRTYPLIRFSVLF
jgi:20S proteasome subunit alpha 5